MARDVGRGIIAPDNSDNIGTGASEMRTLGATTAAAITDVYRETTTRIGGLEHVTNTHSQELTELMQKTGQNRLDLERLETEGVEGLKGDKGEPGPGGSIALEETDPGCFVDSEITWMQWDTSVGTVARAWNPNTQTYHIIYGDTGWRNVTSLIPNVSSGSAYLRRLTQSVTLLLDDVVIDGLSDSWAQLDGFLPTGWRPELSGQMYVPTAARNTSYSNGPVRVRSNGQLVIYDAHQKTVSLVATWPVAQSWPTSLPGN